MSFIRTKKIKGHEYKYEVENYRENGKVKQRILKYIGRKDKTPAPIPVFTIFQKKIKKVRKNGIVDAFVSKDLVNQSVMLEYRWKLIPEQKK